MNDNTSIQTDKKSKPIGLVLISIYGAFSGVLTLFLGAVILLFSSIPDMPAWLTVVSLISTLLGITLLASIYGLWTLQSWGGSLTYWIYMLSIPLAIISIFPIYPDSEFTIGNTILQLCGIAVAIFVLIYIKKPEIQALFTRDAKYA